MFRRSALIIVLLLLCYGYTLPRWADWNQNSRLALVRALIEQGGVRIDAYVETTGDYALFEGHAYSDKAPGPALLATPIYAALFPLLNLLPVERALTAISQRGAFAATLRADGAGLGAERVRVAMTQLILTLLTVALPVACSAAALDWLLRRWFRPTTALLATLGYGIATPIAIYAGNLYSHALVSALLIGAWALIEHAADRARVRWLVLSGLLLGWATISEYPAVVICAALGIYAIARCGWPAAAWLMLGSVPALTALAAYDLLAFRTIWPVGYAYSALWQEQHHTGFVSLTYPHPAALWGLLFSLFRGLFTRAPWLLLAIVGWIGWWRSGQLRAVWWLTISASVGLLLVYGSSQMWWGGFSAGPRYILPIIPFMAVAAAWWIDRADRRHWIALGLVALSVLAVWTEGLAGQQFPPDTIANPWLGWTIPAWQRGDIARNLGMALGLRGAASLLPLVIGVLALLALLIRPRRSRPLLPDLQPVPR